MKPGPKLLLTTGLVFLLLASCGKADRPSSSGASSRSAPVAGAKRQVRVTQAELRPMESTVQVVGTLAPHEEATVAAQVAGQIERAYVDVGSPIKHGAKMALIDTTAYQVLVRQSLANVARATARAENVRQTLARVEQLNRDGVAPRSELDQAVADAGQARAEVQAAEAAAAIAKLNLERSQVKAPFDGQVAQRIAGVGDYVAVGTPILRLVKTDLLRLRLLVPERESPAVKLGQKVRVTVEGDEQLHPGRIARIAPAVREADRVLEVEADVPNPQGLRGGLFARAEIVIDDEGQGLSVPATALVTFAGLEKVVLIRDAMAVEQAVTTGRRGEGWVEIVTGLAAGESIALEPVGLRTGQAVEIKAASAGAPGAPAGGSRLSTEKLRGDAKTR